MKDAMNQSVINNPLENRVPPPVVFVLTGAAMWGFAQWQAGHLQVSAGVRSAGAGALALSGLFFLLMGLGAFSRAKTTIDPVRIERASTLVTTGIYRLTRNPMYVGFATLLVAWACWLMSISAIAGPIFFIIFVTRFQIIPEERAMLAKFADSYADYKKQVRRWL